MEKTTQPWWLRALHFLDNNILFILSIILIVFIPLYPKIPLADLIPGYIVRLRLEDLLIAFTALIWLVWLIRGKINFTKFPLWKWMLAFMIVGVISIFTNVVITQWIPANLLHIGKSALHLIRYGEYFFLGLLFFTSCKTKKQFQITLGAIFFALLAVCVYAVGQKYFYWPLFSTMSREFSKGIILYLSEHARVQSTFGGHYDFAAYLVIVLPITLAVALRLKKIWLKIGAFVIHFFGLWALIMTAARTSFAAYGIALVLLLIIYAAWLTGPWYKKLGRFFGWGAFYAVISLVIIFFFGFDLIERLAQPFSTNYPQLKIAIDNQRRWREDGMKITDILGIHEPSNGVSITAEEQDMVLVASDQTPKPIDIYVDVPDQVIISTMTASGSTTSTEERPRVYSANALKYGLSFAIRLDSLWPWALQGFLRNPLFGSGFGTLNKTAAGIFTEADSTDNNLLRTLGETGALGFIVFYAMQIIVLIALAKQFKSKHKTIKFFALGFFCSLIGLLVNATYIDVYASSKVAFYLWAMVGFFYAMQDYYDEHQLVDLPTPKQTLPKSVSKKSSRKSKKSKQSPKAPSHDQ